MRGAHPRRQLPSQLLALSMSITYAMVVGIGGSMIATRPGQGSSTDYGTEGGSSYTYVPPAGGSSTSPTTPTRGRLPPTTISPPPTTLDFITVSGGGGIVTEVPVGWQRQSRSVTLDEAVDPADESRLLRYGGAPAADQQSLLDRIADAERTASTRRNGYVLRRLDPIAFHDTEAVAWEFEYYDEAGNNLHCSAYYWMVGDIEYVLYAQSLRSDWEDTEPVLERMAETAEPVQ